MNIVYGYLFVCFAHVFKSLQEVFWPRFNGFIACN